MKDFSIVVCTYDRCESLRDTLIALGEMEIPAGKYEIIVVDNNSSDRTKEVVNEFARKSPLDVEYIFEGKQGLSQARNSGIRAAKGNYIAFTDDDVMPDKGWLKCILRAFKETGADCIGGPVLPKWLAQPPAWLLSDRIYMLNLAMVDHGGERIEVQNLYKHYIFGANMAFRRVLFTKYGMFRTDLGRCGNNLEGGEEREMLDRLLKHGCKTIYEPTAKVLHKVEKSRMKLGFFRKYHYEWGRSEIRMSESGARGIQLWVLRQALQKGMASIGNFIKGNKNGAVRSYLEAWYKLGDFRQRVKKVKETTIESVSHSRVLNVEEPIVTVVMTTYNRVDALERAVKSVQAQSLARWELIVADDGSTDTTIEFMNRLAAADSRIRYLRLGNRGRPSFGRNAAISAARGTYITILDDDDEIYPNKLRDQVDYLRENQRADMVYSYVDMIEDESRESRKWPVTPGKSFRDLTRYCMIQPNSILIKRNTLNELMPLKTNVGFCDDYELMMRIARQFRIDFLPVTVGIYRWHDSNISLNKDRRLKDLLAAYKSVLRCGLSEEEKWCVYQGVIGITYSQGNRALLMKEYAKALRYYTYAIKFSPLVGKYLNWSKNRSEAYKIMRPFGAVLVCLMGFAGSFIDSKKDKVESFSEAK